MRIVKFPVTNGIPDYEQFGGVEEFRATTITDGYCIGEYVGNLPEETLPTHVEVVVPSYRTSLSKKELFNSKTGFTGLEQYNIREYIKDPTNAYFSEVYEVVQQLDSLDNVDLKDDEFIDGVQLLVKASLITSERYTEIMKGIPNV